MPAPDRRTPANSDPYRGRYYGGDAAGNSFDATPPHHIGGRGASYQDAFMPNSNFVAVGESSVTAANRPHQRLQMENAWKLKQEDKREAEAIRIQKESQRQALATAQAKERVMTVHAGDKEVDVRSAKSLGHLPAQQLDNIQSQPMKLRQVKQAILASPFAIKWPDITNGPAMQHHTNELLDAITAYTKGKAASAKSEKPAKSNPRPAPLLNGFRSIERFLRAYLKDYAPERTPFPTSQVTPSSSTQRPPASSQSCRQHCILYLFRNDDETDSILTPLLTLATLCGRSIHVVPCPPGERQRMRLALQLSSVTCLLIRDSFPGFTTLWEQAQNDVPRISVPWLQERFGLTNPVQSARNDPAQPTRNDPAPPARNGPAQPKRKGPAQPARNDPAPPTLNGSVQSTRNNLAQPTRNDPAPPACDSPAQPTRNDPAPPARNDPTPPARNDPVPPKRKDPAQPTRKDPAPPARNDPAPPTHTGSVQSAHNSPAQPTRNDPAPSARNDPDADISSDEGGWLTAAQVKVVKTVARSHEQKQAAKPSILERLGPRVPVSHKRQAQDTPSDQWSRPHQIQKRLGL
ncbi:hypothetical protein IWQ60_006478 [Tieghemiomyces parasiticus]|uniref:Uncharacterized protein n=1 Tax=Tieghemiomyces parasiticus TaxID=78921 RepID=A0A9W8AD02_9FUNG|nr:hypothetical protein IWQ60_006478 [Tieghemiomyces parasiticus]